MLKTAREVLYSAYRTPGQRRLLRALEAADDGELGPDGSTIGADGSIDTQVDVTPGADKDDQAMEAFAGMVDKVVRDTSMSKAQKMKKISDILDAQEKLTSGATVGAAATESRQSYSHGRFVEVPTDPEQLLNWMRSN